jgi:type II secretory pathway component PulF
VSSVTTDLRKPDPAGADDLALLHRTLAELCRAKVPLPKAFRILSADLGKGNLKTAIEEMREEIEAGAPLAEAYGKRKKTFPKLYRALVEAGCASGDLPGALEEIADHAAFRAEVAERVRKALAYPIVTGMFVLVLGIGALSWAMPRLWILSDEITTDPFAMFQLTGGKSAPVPPYALIGLGIVAVFVVGAFLAAWAKNPGALGGGFRFPVVGRLRLASARASLASTLAMLLRRKLPLPQALDLAAEATENRRFRETVHGMAGQARGGTGLSGTVTAAGIFEPSVAWMVETADGSESAVVALADVAEIYRRRLARGLDRFTVLLTPMAQLVLGVAVFLFAYSFVVPLLEYAGKVFGG